MSPVAIVTASDSGIGQESAKELAENGFDIPFSEYKNLIASGVGFRAVLNESGDEIRRWEITSETS